MQSHRAGSNRAGHVESDHADSQPAARTTPQGQRRHRAVVVAVNKSAFRDAA